MVYLYKMNNTNFEWNGDYSLAPTECTFKQELNGMWEITLNHPLEGNWKQINYEDVIQVNTPTKKPQLFRVYDKFKSMDGIIVKARHVFYDLKDKVLMDVRPTNQNGKGYLDIILQGTKFKGSSNITRVATSYFIRKNIIEAINAEEENSFINRLGGEILLDNFNIAINDRIGADNGIICSYGKDLESIEETLNIDNVVTRAIITGAEGIVLPYTIDSPNINKYANIKEKIIPFDNVKVGEEEGDYATLELAYKELDRLGRIYVNNNDTPLVNYKIDILALENTEEYKDFRDLQKINLGDTVTIKHKLLDIDIKVRCISIEYDCLNNKYVSIELGNYIHDVIDDINKNSKEIESTKEKLSDTKEDLENTIEKTSQGFKIELKNTKEGLESRVDYTAKELKIQFQEGDKNLSSYISETAKNIEMQVNNAEERASSKFEMLDREITLKVDKDGVISAINLSSGRAKISADKVDITGFVTISDLSGGSTTINGYCIRTGQIEGIHVHAENFSAKGSVYFYQGVNIGGDVYSRGTIGAKRDLQCEGNLNVTGTKNCIQTTKNFGKVLINAYETAEVYYGDLQFGVIKEGVCVVKIDPKMLECFNTEIPYHVFTQTYNGTNLKMNKYPSYVVFKGEEGTEFSYEIKAKRRGYENTRLAELVKKDGDK